MESRTWHEVVCSVDCCNGIKVKRKHQTQPQIFSTIFLKKRAAFIVGKLPPVIAENNGASTSLFCFVAYSIANVTGKIQTKQQSISSRQPMIRFYFKKKLDLLTASVINGKVFDKFGWKVLVGNIITFWGCSQVCLYLGIFLNMPFFFYVCYAFIGFVDSSDNLMVCALVSKLWKNDVGTYLSGFKRRTRFICSYCLQKNVTSLPFRFPGFKWHCVSLFSNDRGAFHWGNHY